LEIHALAHVTGGGITDNLPRVLPAGTRAQINLATWTPPPVFAWLRHQGRVAEAEMLRTFNCGVGLLVILPEARVDEAMSAFTQAGETPWRIGRIDLAEGAPKVDYVNNLTWQDVGA
jgi:phosphoribosylformylglycinamidine cyclo-ligase